MGYDITVWLVYGIALDYKKINQMRDLHRLIDLENKSDNDLEVFAFDINNSRSDKFLGYKYSLEQNPDIVSGGRLGPELYTLPAVLEHGNHEFLDHMAQVCGSTPRWYIFQDLSY